MAKESGHGKGIWVICIQNLIEIAYLYYFVLICCNFQCRWILLFRGHEKSTVGAWHAWRSRIWWLWLALTFHNRIWPVSWKKFPIGVQPNFEKSSTFRTKLSAILRYPLRYPSQVLSHLCGLIGRLATHDWCGGNVLRGHISMPARLHRLHECQGQNDLCWYVAVWTNWTITYSQPLSRWTKGIKLQSRQVHISDFSMQPILCRLAKGAAFSTCSEDFHPLRFQRYPNFVKCPNFSRWCVSIWQNHIAGRGGKEARAAEKVLYAVARVFGFPHMKIAKHRFLCRSYLYLRIKVTSLNFNVPSVVRTTAVSVIACRRHTASSLSSPPELVSVPFLETSWNSQDKHHIQRKAPRAPGASQSRIILVFHLPQALRRWHAHGTAAGWDHPYAITGRVLVHGCARKWRALDCCRGSRQHQNG